MQLGFHRTVNKTVLKEHAKGIAVSAASAGMGLIAIGDSYGINANITPLVSVVLSLIIISLPIEVILRKVTGFSLYGFILRR